MLLARDPEVDVGIDERRDPESRPLPSTTSARRSRSAPGLGELGDLAVADDRHGWRPARYGDRATGRRARSASARRGTTGQRGSSGHLPDPFSSRSRRLSDPSGVGGRRPALRPGAIAAGEELVEDRHPTTRPLSTWAVISDWGESITSGASSTPRLTGPGCMRSWRGPSRLGVDLVAAAYSRSEGTKLSLALRCILSA